jgi:hypothetical protein
VLREILNCRDRFLKDSLHTLDDCFRFLDEFTAGCQRMRARAVEILLEFERQAVPSIAKFFGHAVKEKAQLFTETTKCLFDKYLNLNTNLSYFKQGLNDQKKSFIRYT